MYSFLKHMIYLHDNDKDKFSKFISKHGSKILASDGIDSIDYQTYIMRSINLRKTNPKEFRASMELKKIIEEQPIDPEDDEMENTLRNTTSVLDYFIKLDSSKNILYIKILSKLFIPYIMRVIDRTLSAKVNFKQIQYNDYTKVTNMELIKAIMTMDKGEVTYTFLDMEDNIHLSIHRIRD